MYTCLFKLSSRNTWKNLNFFSYGMDKNNRQITAR